MTEYCKICEIMNLLTYPPQHFECRSDPTCKRCSELFESRPFNLSTSFSDSWAIGSLNAMLLFQLWDILNVSNSTTSLCSSIVVYCFDISVAFTFNETFYEPTRFYCLLSFLTSLNFSGMNDVLFVKTI